MMLTIAEVQHVIPAPVGEPLPTGTGEGCSYGNRKEERTTTLLLNVTPDDDIERFHAARDEAAKTADVRGVEGIGDDAFAYGNQSTHVETAEARKGSHRVRVLIEGPEATPEKALQGLRSAVARV